MIKIENAQIVGLKPAIRGMRNPMNSWEKSDSGMCDVIDDNYGDIIPSDFRVGKADYDLMLRLARAGSVDGKFRRMIARSSQCGQRNVFENWLRNQKVSFQ